MRAFLVCVVMLVGVLMGGEKEHLALAKEFDRLSGAQDKELAAEAYVSLILTHFPEEEHREEELKDVVHKMITSEDYLERKARVYMEVFTEEELEEIIEVVKLPGFKLLNSKRVDIAMGLAELSDELMISDKMQAVLFGEDGDDPETKELSKKLDFEKVSKDILAAFDALASAEGIEQLGKLVVGRDRVVPLMLEYYKGDEIRWVAPKVRNVEVLSFADDIYRCVVGLEDFSEKVVAFEKVEDHYLLDWESWVGHSEISWKTFKELKPTEPFLVRVTIQRNPYYNFEFMDEERWDSYSMLSPDQEEVIYGYVEKSSLLAKTMIGASWSFGGGDPRVTLRVEYPEGEKQANQLLITEFVAGGWVVRESEEEGKANDAGE